MPTAHSQPVNVRSREVQNAVDTAQHRRQVLIFAIQFLFGVNIALVYHAWSQSGAQDPFHGPSGILLACYAVCSLWCLRRSAKHRLRWFDVAVSIVVDFAVCIDVILRYDSAAASGSSALSEVPLFSFVYLFIAMRCLHYRAAYVYVAGALAALTWAMLMLTPIPASAESLLGALRTLTFNEALLSGAVDKLITIVAVTVVLGACAREARRNLYESAFRGAAGKGLVRLVGKNVANEVLFSREAHVPGRGRLQMVAIVMIDIRNFTKLAAKADPSDVIALLASYQQLVEPVIIRYGGCIDKFMGDGILAHFGALEQDPRFVAQALRCVEHLLYVTDRWNGKRVAGGFHPLQFRVACAVGEAVVGLVGGESKVEFTVIGDPVNLTAKLEKHAKKLGARALTTSKAFNMARHQGFSPTYAIRQVKADRVVGVDAEMDLVVLGDRSEKTEKPSAKRQAKPGAKARNAMRA